MAGILFPKEAKAENTDLRAEDVQAEEPEQEEGVEDTEDMLYDKLKERARQNMNIPRELFEKGQELVKAGKKAARIPLLASEVLEGMVKGKTKVRFELSGYEEPLNQIFHFLRYTVLTMVALVLFIGSCILCTTDFKPILPNGVPLLAVTGIVFSIALAIFSIKKLK
jgi:ubiquinone biosynthesis protein